MFQNNKFNYSDWVNKNDGLKSFLENVIKELSTWSPSDYNMHPHLSLAGSSLSDTRFLDESDEPWVVSDNGTTRS